MSSSRLIQEYIFFLTLINHYKSSVLLLLTFHTVGLDAEAVLACYFKLQVRLVPAGWEFVILVRRGRHFVVRGRGST